MEHSVNLVISDEEKERVWPWLDKVRERETQITQNMTPDEKIAYYQVELKRLRKQQNYLPPI